MHCNPWAPGAKFPWPRPGDWLTGITVTRTCKQLLTSHTSWLPTRCTEPFRQHFFLITSLGRWAHELSAFIKQPTQLFHTWQASMPAIHIQKQRALLTRHNTILTSRRMLTSETQVPNTSMSWLSQILRLSVSPPWFHCLSAR